MPNFSLQKMMSHAECFDQSQKSYKFRLKNPAMSNGEFLKYEFTVTQSIITLKNRRYQHA